MCTLLSSFSTCPDANSELSSLTDTILPKCLSPKWAMNIRKMFNLSKEDDVRRYVICREVKSGKKENMKWLPRFSVLLLPSVSRAIATSALSSAENWSTRRSRILSMSEYSVSVSVFSPIHLLALSLPSASLKRRPRLVPSKHHTISSFLTSSHLFPCTYTLHRTTAA